ncbi:MAG: hypothetical protein RIQ47_218 [Bacteroidota bacterium]|jgi:uncharacterized protein (TIGR00661 family)
MKILYAIQGTGNGHVTRAMELVPILKKKGSTDILISGIQSDIELPFHVDYSFKGLSFIFGKNGGVDVWKTYLKMKSYRLLRDISSIDIYKYDLVISDFEPISAWACRIAGVPCVGLSNQVATLHPLAPKPKSNDRLGKLVLRHYAPTTFNYGFHFKSLDQTIYTPIIRSRIRKLKPVDKGHYTVYLPSYDDEKIIKRLKRYSGIRWEIFSKHTKKAYTEGRFRVYPIEEDRFIESLSTCRGLLSNAGFGATSEALFLGKKLLVVPMKTQYEQHCNAAMLESMGITVLKSIKQKHADTISSWLDSDRKIDVDYPSNAKEIINTIVERHAGIKNSNFDAFNSYPLFQ